MTSRIHLVLGLGAVLAGSSFVLACSEPPPAAPAAAAPVTAPAVAEAEPAAAPAATPSPATSVLASAGATAELGKPAPEFTLQDVHGTAHALGALRGKTVVLEWFNPDCPFVKYSHTRGPLVDLAKRSVGSELVWLSINSGAEGKQGHGVERNRAALAQYGIENPILLDPTGEVGKAYAAQKTPHLFVIDPAGVLVYRGGLDNAPMGSVDSSRPRYEDSPEGALVNYLDGALEDLKQPRALRLPDTPPYGCSVKYDS